MFYSATIRLTCRHILVYLHVGPHLYVLLKLLHQTLTETSTRRVKMKAKPRAIKRLLA